MYFLYFVFQERREAMEVCVPDEPSPDSEEKICTLRIRYPDGSQVQRRFLAENQLQVLLTSTMYC